MWVMATGAGLWVGRKKRREALVTRNKQDLGKLGLWREEGPSEEPPGVRGAVHGARADCDGEGTDSHREAA